MVASIGILDPPRLLSADAGMPAAADSELWNNNNNNGPSGGQRGVEKSVSYIAGFVVQG